MKLKKEKNLWGWRDDGGLDWDWRDGDHRNDGRGGWGGLCLQEKLEVRQSMEDEKKMSFNKFGWSAQRWVESDWASQLQEEVMWMTARICCSEVYVTSAHVWVRSPSSGRGCSFHQHGKQLRHESGQVFEQKRKQLGFSLISEFKLSSN